MRTGDFMKAYIQLSDTIPNPSIHTAPGFRWPGEYKWNDEHQAHILDGRVFDLEVETDRIAFNEACMNAMRVPHKWHFPVAVVAKKLVESGFDEPEVVVITTQLVGPIEPEPAPEPAPTPPPADPEPPIGPPTTAGARKKARQLGVDIELLRGKGTGVAGIITVDDVIGQWHADGNSPHAPAASGPVSMAELMTSTADTP